MANVNQQLQDEAINHEVDLRRFATGVIQRMIAVLNRSDASLAAQLSEALMRMDAQSFTVERLNALLSSMRAVNTQAYQQVMAALHPEIQSLAKVEAAAQTSQLSAALPAVVKVRFPVAGVSWEQVYAAALSRPFQGRLLSDWATNLEQSRLTAISNAVRTGFVEGKTTSDIIKTVRGTRAAQYADGLLQRPRQELAAVVQTALSHTAQTARQASYDANADLIKALAWLSTLDNRTTKQFCIPRDGLQYTADASHKPIGHNFPWLGGPGKIHWNCRSVSIPVLRSWRELGIPVDDMTPQQRASMDGTVPATTTYADWLQRQSAARQDEILGPVRAKMYRDGDVTLGQMYNSRGDFLTLDQLRDKLGS